MAARTAELEQVRSALAASQAELRAVRSELAERTAALEGVATQLLRRQKELADTDNMYSSVADQSECASRCLQALCGLSRQLHLLTLAFKRWCDTAPQARRFWS